MIINQDGNDEIFVIDLVSPLSFFFESFSESSLEFLKFRVN